MCNEQPVFTPYVIQPNFKTFYLLFIIIYIVKNMSFGEHMFLVKTIFGENMFFGKKYIF